MSKVLSGDATLRDLFTNRICGEDGTDSQAASVWIDGSCVGYLMESGRDIWAETAYGTYLGRFPDAFIAANTAAAFTGHESAVRFFSKVFDACRGLDEQFARDYTNAYDASYPLHNPQELAGLIDSIIGPK